MSYGFDANGKLTSVTRNGQLVESRTYYTPKSDQDAKRSPGWRGRLATVTDAGGRTLTYTYSDPSSWGGGATSTVTVTNQAGHKSNTRGRTCTAGRCRCETSPGVAAPATATTTRWVG